MTTGMTTHTRARALDQYERMLRWHAKLTPLRQGVAIPPIKGPFKVRRVKSADARGRRSGSKRVILNVPRESLLEIATAVRATVGADDVLDIVQVFFQQCFHLKDWIKNDPAAGRASRAVERFVADSAVLELARDICNGSKHLVLRAPRATPTLKHGPFVLGQRGGGLFVGAAPRIEIDGKDHDAFDLADQCVAAWNVFMRNQRLI